MIKCYHLPSCKPNAFSCAWYIFMLHSSNVALLSDKLMKNYPIFMKFLLLNDRIVLLGMTAYFQANRSNFRSIHS